MISAIRRSFGKRMTHVILWITLISLAGISSFVGLMRRFSGIPENTIAEVGGYDISLMDFRRKAAAEEQRLAYYRKQFGPYAAYFLQSLGLSDNAYENALQSLIQEKLILTAADKINLQLAHHFVMKKLEDPAFALQAFPEIVPPFIYDSLGGLDTKLLIKYVQRQGMSIGQFEKSIEDALRRMIVVELLPTTVYVPQAKIEQQYIKDNVSRSYDVLTLALEGYLKQAKKEILSPEELRSFFETQNALNKRYWIPEKRDAHVWTFKAGDFGTVITDAELEKGYMSHKDHFIAQPAKIVVRKITVPQEAEAHTLAQEFNQYPLRFTEKSGKQTEIISDNSKHEAVLKEAAFALNHDGAVSPAIKTESGYVILGRVSKQDAVYKPLEQVKSELALILKQEKFAAQFTQEAQEMLSAMQAFVQAKKGVEHTRTSLEQDNGDFITQKIFAMQQSGEKIAFVHDGKGVIVELLAVAPARAAEFSAIQERIKEDVYQEKARELLQADMKLIQESLKASTPLKDLVKQYKATHETYQIKDKRDGQWEKLAQKELPTHRMMNMTRSGSLVTELTDKQGFIVVLSRVAPVDMATDGAHMSEIKKELINQEANFIGAAFIASLQKNVTINMNNSLIAAAINRPR